MFNWFRKSALKTIDKKLVNNEIQQFKSKGTTGDDKDIIVSLTSFPERMNEIHYTLYSILTQSLKPGRVILWLAIEQFPNGEKDIPEQVLKLRENGLTIKWTHNTYSYKKLIPALIQYPENIIVTADDDIFYENTWLENLVNSYNKNKNCVISHRAHQVKLTKEGIAPYKKWKKQITNSKPSYTSFLTGAGGVLYPPKVFYKDITNEDLFTQLAPKADDVWFWAMAVLNGSKICVTKKHVKKLTYINPERERGLTNETTLFASNKKGGNDLQIQKVIEHYPEIINILKSKN